MKKIKIYLIVLAFSSTLAHAFAQSTIDDDKAHRRYWYYRTRFINDFIKMGKNQGECIVLAERNQGVNDPTALVGPDQIDLSNMYLATLALEYKLLTRNSQNTDETIKEIYQLLYTINRLDLEAEYFWNTSDAVMDANGQALQANGSANGYMLREDFPKTFIPNNLDHFNYEMKLGLNTNGGFTGLPHVNKLKMDVHSLGYTDDVGGKFTAHFVNPYDYPKKHASLVHDKYYSMLAAFMFIVKYIPSNTYYYEGGYAQPFQDGSYGIKEQAKAITNRLRWYVSGNTYFPGPNPNDWVIRQPDGSNIGLGAGASMALYSFGTSRAICHINQGYPWHFTDVCAGYSDNTSTSIGINYYNLAGGVQPGGDDNAVFIAWNQVMCNFPIGMFPCWLGMWANTQDKKLEWAELAREVLFQTHPMHSSISKVEDPLSVAPCNGPYNFTDQTQWSMPNADWSSQDRTEHPSAMNKPTSFKGNYPGVDYMFLHNLFYEYLNQGNLAGKYDKAINLMDNYDTQTWPQWSNTVGGLIGTTTTPQNVHVFQNLSSRAQINSLVPSKVDYRAGKEIALLSEDGAQAGFSVQDGSEFSAHIERYLCSNSDYGSGLRSADSGNDYETDDMNTLVATHTVSHPLSDSDLNPGPLIEDSPLVQNKRGSGSNEGLAIFPNPNNGVFKIAKEKMADNEILHLMIVDMKGVVVFEDVNFATRDFDFTDFTPGIYLVKVNSSLGYTDSKKVNITR